MRKAIRYSCSCTFCNRTTVKLFTFYSASDQYTYSIATAERIEMHETVSSPLQQRQFNENCLFYFLDFIHFLYKCDKFIQALRLSQKKRLKRYIMRKLNKKLTMQTLL